MKRLVIGGVASGVGKTTVACAIMAAFHRRSYRVQPFKAGPDYIDPSHHARAAGRPSRNLDSVLVPPETMRMLFARAASSADLSVVEGVMGLFDGRNGAGEEGSTAQIAKLLEVPMLVVIDVARTARTAGAIALGCLHFDPELRIAGFILNRVASESHGRAATEAVEGATGRPVLGAFPRNPELAVPERHLGLVPAGESPTPAEFFDRLAVAAEQYLELDRIWALAEAGPLLTDPLPVPPSGSPATVAIAQDPAFSFYYEDSLDLLRLAGAELVPFSPLHDQQLPRGTQGVYLGGGFPELFAAGLAANEPMRREVKAAAVEGVPVYGECGGLMYLGRALTDFEGVQHQMVGLLPLHSAMRRQRAALGYRTVRALRSNLLMDAGNELRGHEFHYSELETSLPAETAAYELLEREGAYEGYARGNVLASYMHLHFGARADLAPRFVQRCRNVCPR